MLKPTWAAAAMAALLMQWTAPATAGNPDPSVIVSWNQRAQATFPATFGPLTSRQYTILHIAMFDAVNAIERGYTPFRAHVASSSGASAKAAAAQAAHDVLVSLVPTSAATYDTFLTQDLAGIPPGLRKQGVAVGRAVAAEILAWRATDGAFAPQVPYVLPVIPGLWQPTGAPAGLTQVPKIPPFTLASATQFLVARFPEMNTPRYATDFEEVRLYGSFNSAVRSTEQTQIAKQWAAFEIADTLLFSIWNNVARQVVEGHHLSMLQAARLYALMNVSMIDSLITTVSGKFIYALWRPVTAIAGAAGDENPATNPEAGWAPLLPTPPYPTYPGNMAGQGAAASRALALSVGSDEFAFSATWHGINGNPDATRNYSTFSQLSQEEANSRVWGGIHFRFDNEASQEVCRKIAEQADANYMKPLQ